MWQRRFSAEHEAWGILGFALSLNSQDVSSQKLTRHMEELTDQQSIALSHGPFVPRQLEDNEVIDVPEPRQ